MAGLLDEGRSHLLRLMTISPAPGVPWLIELNKVEGLNAEV